MKKQSAPYRNRARGPALVLELPAAVAARMEAKTAPEIWREPNRETYDLRSLPEVKRRLNLKFVRLEGAVMVYEIKD